MINDEPANFWGTPDLRPTDVSDRHDVVVVGAGITGLTTAVLLAERGVDVAVLEGRYPGAGTTSRSTAKATLLQGTRMSQIVRMHGPDVAWSYLYGNRLGQDIIQRVVGDSGAVDHEIRDCWTFATSESGAGSVRAEHEALRDLGLPVQLDQPKELPFTTRAAVRLGEQWQINPVQYLAALHARLIELGGRITWPHRVESISENNNEMRVTSTTGDVVTARWVVVSTLLPFPRRTLVFANSTPSRSHNIAARVIGDMPQDMYLSADSPTRSLRTANSDSGEEFLLVGGYGHPTGKKNPVMQHVRDLSRWAETHFEVKDITHRWSAQDYSSVDMLPQIGRSPLGPERMLISTDMGKWGMTNGSAAAQAMTDIILGEEKPWAEVLRPRLNSKLNKLMKLNGEVAFNLVKGWTVEPRRRGVDRNGTVRRSGVAVDAISYVGGERKVCSAVCTHLGGIVRWNDADNTWDCPLHGSVFDTDGQVLEGPAVEPLAGG